MARLLVETSALPWHKVPEDMRENFIFTGYRPASMGIFRSLRSAFLLHNETLNIWTHMLPVFYFLYFLWLDAEMWIEMDLPHDQRFPLYGYILGICILFGTSGCAHWLNCVSWHWRHVFFMLDYGAISVYGVATAVAYYFYSHSKTPMISQGTGYFLPLTVGAAIFATWLCCWTRVNHSLVPNVCHIVRTLAFGLPFLVGSLPAIVRFLGPYLATIDTSVLPSHMQQTIANHSHLTHNDDLTFQHHYVRHFVLLLIGAFIHMAKIPERWFPGLFDIFGHSHQWFHLFVFLSIREQFWLVIWDIRDSRQAGALFTTSSTLSTLVVYAVLVVMVMATIAWFSQYTGDEELLPGEHAACCCSRRPSCNSEQVDNKTSQCGCKHDSVIVDKTKSVRRRDIVQKRKNPGAKATAQNSSAVIAANGEENGDLVLREDGGESCCPCNPQVRRRTCTQECCSYPI